MKNQVFYMLVLLTLAACDNAPSITPATPEERTLFTILEKMEWGLGYDRHCVGHGRNMEGYLYANVQQIIHQIGDVLIKQNPKGLSEKEHEDKMFRKLNTHTDILRPQIDKTFEKEGCTSKSTSITEAKRAYNLFTKTPPAKMKIAVQQQIDIAVKGTD